MTVNKYVRFEGWSVKRAIAIAVILCVTMTACGPIIPAPPGTERGITGCYVYDDCVYMHVLSSFRPMKGYMPYVYGISEDRLIIANTETGDIEAFDTQYRAEPVAEDEFGYTDTASASLMSCSIDISGYKERCLLAGTEDTTGYRVYGMDGEIWLVKYNENCIWSVYRLKKNNETTLDDLLRALGTQESAAEKRPMTLKDVYALSRKGDELTLRDFESFTGKNAGSGFYIMRYDVQGGCAVIVHSGSPDAGPNYIRLSKQGYDPFDEDLTVDIRDGYDAVAQYLDPLNSLMNIDIIDTHRAIEGKDLIYEYGGYSYCLGAARQDPIIVVFEDGERMELRQALSERRITIEDAVSNGLSGVFMYPSDNPLGGNFTRLHHNYTFSLDKEQFYPSASFMYVADMNPYYDIYELIGILDVFDRQDLAQKLRDVRDGGGLMEIAGKSYVGEERLSDIGLVSTVGWVYSSHTPVWFSTGQI